MENSNLNSNNGGIKNLIFYSILFFAAVLAFVITVTIKTNLEAIKQEAVYKLMYSLFILVCTLPFISLFANALKYFKFSKSNLVFISYLAVAVFVVAIFIYADGNTVPGGTENIFQYAITKLYKQHFRYVLMFLLGATCFGQFIFTISIKRFATLKGFIFNIALTFLWAVALIVNVVLSVIYFNYVHAVTTLIIDLSIIVIAVYLTVLNLIKK